MGKFSCIIACLLIAGCAANQETKRTLDDGICWHDMCQRNIHVVLKRQDGTVFDQTYALMPAVEQTGAFVMAGQTLLFEADRNGDRLSNLKLVEKITHPEKTISATLEQAKDGQMMLTIHNPFDKYLKFKMQIMPLGRDDLYKTSSCPAVPKGGDFELWPYPILQVWLGVPAHPLVDKKSFSCAY
jgi:hypothetical protein